MCASYYSLVRQDVIELIPPGTSRLLDVGCGEGATAEAAKRRLNISEVWGIEQVEAVAAVARGRLDGVVRGDVETLSFQWPEGYFDCILCADVLEHLRDPWTVLKRLHGILGSQGVIIASLPNARHVIPLFQIIWDRLEYTSSGILDQTHLRFFTLHTMKKMFVQTGYEITGMVPRYSYGWKLRLFNFATLGRLKPFTIYQYLLVAKKT